MTKTTKSARPSTGSATVHDQKLTRGEGGELHQTATGKTTVLTTAQGGPVSDDQNSLKIGPRGATVLEDFHFREKIFHFDHERIPERVVHARGYGAHGYFENTSRYRGTPGRTYFKEPEKRRRHSFDSPRLREAKGPLTWHAMSAALLSNSTHRKATGTSLVTISRCSSSRTQSNFRI
jgi:Catalase